MSTLTVDKTDIHNYYKNGSQERGDFEDGVWFIERNEDGTYTVETDDPKQTIDQFIEKHGIKCTIKPASYNPYLLGYEHHVNGRPWAAFHYRAIFRKDGHQFSTPFSQGSGHTEPPTPGEVLSCVAGDVAGVQGQVYSEWASEYGYDPYEGEGEKTFNIIQRQAKRLENFLGRDTLEELLYNTEPL